MATLTQDPPADRYKNISQIQIPKQVQNVLKQRGVDITAMQNDINARIGKGGEEKAKAIEGTFGVFDEILGGYQYRDILDRELKFSTINEAQQAASQAPDVSQIAVPATSPEQTPKPANDRIIGATTAAAIYNSMVDGQKGFFQLIASSIGSAVTDQEKVKAVNDAIGSFYNTKKFDLSDTPAPVYWDTEKDELNVDNVMNVRAWEAIFGQGIGSMLPQILLTYGTQAVVTALGTGATGGLGAGGAAVAGKVAGKAVGAITGLEKKTKNIIRAGSFVMSASQMYPGYLEEATAAGLPYADAQIIAGSTAMTNAGLEMWGLERIMKVFGTNDAGARTIMRGVLDQSAKTVIKSMAGKKISNDMFLEAIKEGAKKSINILTKGGRSAAIKAAVETGKRVAKNAGPEFGEEFLQEWVGYGAQRIYNSYVADKGATPGQGKYDTNVMSTLVNSGLGATTGGILGGSMTLFQASPRIYDQTAYAMTLADVKNQIDNGATNLDEIKQSGKLFGAIEGWRQSGAFNGQQGFNQQEYDQVVSNADLMYDTAWAFKDYDGFSGSDSEAMFRVAQTKQNMRNKMAAIEESKQTVAQIDEEIANAPDSATEAKLRMEKVKVEKTLGILDPETNIYEAESIQTAGQAEVNNLTGTFTTAMATPENRPLARQFLESGLSAIDDKYAPSTENRSDFAPNFVDRLSDGSVVTYDTKMGIRFVRETPVEGVTVLDQLGKKSYKPPIRVQVSTEPIVDFNQFQEAASLPYASAPLSIREGIDGLSDSNEVLDFARNEVLSGEPAPESIDQAFDLYNRISNSRAGKDSGVQPMTRDEFDVAIGLQQEIKTEDVAPTAEEDSPITEDQVDTTQDDEILAFQERTGRGFNLNDEYKVSELTMDAINEIEAGSTSVPLLRINTAITELAKERKRWSNMRQASGRQYTTDQINEMLKAIDSDLERLTNEKAYQEEPETRPIVIPKETTTEVQETNGETIEDTDTESTESSRQIAPDIQSEYASEGELAPLAASIDESTVALRESIEQIEESPEVDEETGGIDGLIGEIDSILSEVGRTSEQREAEFTQISNGYDPEGGYDADGPVDVETLLVEDSADTESPTIETGSTSPVTSRDGVIDWGPAPGPNLVAKRVPGERVSDREGYKMIPVPGSKKGEYQYAPIWTPDRFVDPADDIETEGAVVNDGVDEDEIGSQNIRFQQTPQTEGQSFDLLSIFDSSNKVNYEQVTRIADTILSGEAHIARLMVGEEQGRTRGGRTNVEASLILRADQSANPERYTDQPRQEIIARQEQLLRDYAREKGLMIDEKSTAENALQQLPSGFESEVYLSEDAISVDKFLKYRVLDNTADSFLDNRVSLYNYLFPETSYTLKGFSEDPNTGQFKFVLSQPFVQGRNLDFNNPSEVSALNEKMAENGFREMAPGVYISDDYALFDLRNGNVKITPEGQYAFIDVVSVLNEKRTGGDREYGSGDIVVDRPIVRQQTATTQIPTTPDQVRSVLNALAQAFPNIAVNIPNTLQEYVDRINNITGAKELYRANETAPYGYLDPSNGQIYLNPETLNTNTPIHEYGHIWSAWTANNDPELYARGRDLALNSPYYRTVANDPRYSNLTQEEMIQEAMAMAIGDKGAKYVTRARRNKLMQWLSDIFDKVKQYLGFTGSTSALENMTFEQFAQMAAEQLLSGNQISWITSEDAASLFNPPGQTAEEFAEEAEGTGPRIRTMLPPAKPLGTTPGGAGFQMMTAAGWKTEAERLLGGILTTKRKDFSKSDKSIIDQVKKNTGWEYLGNDNWKNHLGAAGIHMLYTNTDEIVYMPHGGGTRSAIAQAMEDGLMPLVRDKSTMSGYVFDKAQKSMIANAINLDTFVSMVDNEDGIFRRLITDPKNHGRRLRAYARGELKPSELQWKQKMAKFSRNGSNESTVETVPIDIVYWDDKAGRAEKKTIYVTMSVAMNLVRTHQSQMSMDESYLDIGGEIHSSLVIDSSKLDMFGNVADPTDRSTFIAKDGVFKGARLIGGAKEIDAGGNLVPVRDSSGNELNDLTVLLSESEMDKYIDMMENGTGASDPDRVKEAYALGTKFFNNEKVAELMKKENDEILNPDRPFTAVSFYAPVRTVKNVSADASVNSFSPSLDDAKQLHNRVKRPDALYIGDDLDAGNYYLKGVESVLGNGRLVSNLKQIKDAIAGESYQGGPHKEAISKYLDKAISDFQDVKASQAKEMNAGWFMRMANYMTQKNTAFIFRGNIGIAAIQTGTYASAYGQGVIENKYLNQAAPNMFKLAGGGIIDSIGGAGSTVVEGTDKGKKSFLGTRDTFEREQLEWLTGEHITDPAEKAKHRELFATIIDRLLYGNSHYTEGIDFTKTNFDREIAGPLGQAYAAWDQWWEEKGMGPIRRVDRAVILSFMKAAQLQVADEVKAGTISAANADAKIASLTESVMYVTNQMNEITDMTGIQRNWNPIYKAITIYTGQTQKLFNQMTQNFFEYQKWKDTVSDDKRRQMRNRLARSIFNNMLVNTVVVAVVRSAYSALRAVIRGDEPEDEEFYAKKVGFDTLRMVFGIYPGLPEQFVGYWLSKVDNERWEEGLFEIPGTKAVEETLDLSVNAYKYITSEDDKAKDRYKGSLLYGVNKLLGLWTGTPKIITEFSNRLIVPPKGKKGNKMPSDISTEEIDELLEEEELPEEVEEVLE